MRADTGLSGLSGFGGDFTPESVPGLKVWVEADMEGDDLQTSGGKVTDWGAAHLPQFVQTDDAKRYVLVADAGDGLPELTAVSPQAMSIASLTLSSSFTAFGIWRTNWLANTMVVEHSAAAHSVDGLWGPHISSSSSTWRVRRGTSTVAEVLNSSIDLGDDVYRIVVQESTGANQTVFINASEEDTNASSIGVSDVTDTLYLTSRTASERYLNGAIRAWLIYTPVLSAGHRVQVCSYLNEKWGVF